jgi:hypothetical protein
MPNTSPSQIAMGEGRRIALPSLAAAGGEPPGPRLGVRALVRAGQTDRRPFWRAEQRDAFSMGRMRHFCSECTNPIAKFGQFAPRTGEADSLDSGPAGRTRRRYG